MNIEKKWISICAVSFIVLGTILILSSLHSIDKKDTSITEKDAPIVYGTNLTHYYNVREKLSLEFNILIKSKVLPDLIQLNFTIIAPSGNETVFVYWLKSYVNPYNPGIFPEVILNELEILKVEKLILENSSELEFVGEVTESGNYTLVFTSHYTKENTLLSRLSLLRIIVRKEYPYTLLMPLGIGFIIVGIVLALWVRSPSKKSPRHKANKYRLNREG